MALTRWSRRCAARAIGFDPGSNMARSWWTVRRRLTLLFLGATLLGGITQQWLLTLLLAALGGLAWQLWQLYRLDRWLDGDQDVCLPHTGPVWDGIQGRIARLYRQGHRLQNANSAGCCSSSSKPSRLCPMPPSCSARTTGWRGAMARLNRCWD